MIRLFQSVISRVKAMFTLDAMLDLEQQFLTPHAERRADLIREADRYRQGDDRQRLDIELALDLRPKPPEECHGSGIMTRRR